MPTGWPYFFMLPCGSSGNMIIRLTGNGLSD